jgi:hypothetical protein
VRFYVSIDVNEEERALISASLGAPATQGQLRRWVTRLVREQLKTLARAARDEARSAAADG